MPNNVVKSYAKKTGKSVLEVEEIWSQTSDDAFKKFKQKTPAFYAYVNATVERKLGLKESFISLEDACLLLEMEES